jgi:hypothetical protein
MYDNGGMAVGPQETVLAPRFSRVLTVLIVAICAVAEVSLVVWGHVEVLLRATPALAFVAFGTWVLFWVPLIRLTPDDVEVVNPLRTHTVPWGAIRDITARFSLTLQTDAGQVTAWASPAESPWASLGRFRRDALGRPSLGPEDPSRLPRDIGGLAPVLVQRQWEAHRDTATGEPTTRWHIATIVVLAALLVLTIVGIGWQ